MPLSAWHVVTISILAAMEVAAIKNYTLSLNILTLQNFLVSLQHWLKFTLCYL